VEPVQTSGVVEVEAGVYELVGVPPGKYFGANEFRGGRRDGTRERDEFYRETARYSTRSRGGAGSPA